MTNKLGLKVGDLVRFKRDPKKSGEKNGNYEAKKILWQKRITLKVQQVNGGVDSKCHLFRVDGYPPSCSWINAEFSELERATKQIILIYEK